MEELKDKEWHKGCEVPSMETLSTCVHVSVVMDVLSLLTLSWFRCGSTVGLGKSGNLS